MNKEGPFENRRRGLDKLVYTGAERRHSRYVSTTQLEAGMNVEGLGPIANTFTNPDGSYKIVFENGHEIGQLDRDDGLDVLNDPVKE